MSTPLHPPRRRAPVRWRRAGTVATACAAAVVVAGCGGSSGGGLSSGGNPSVSVASQSANTSLANKVPAEIKSDGVIRIGTDATYAPSEFLAADGKTVEGFDVDLFNAVAQKLGLKTKWVPATFNNIIPSVQSGKYEIGVSSFTINADREKETDMISYFSAGTQWATQKGNPHNVQPDAACGHKIAVQKDTVQVDDLNARSKKCRTAGKHGITIDQYVGQDQATSSVVSGKDEAMLADSPVVAYAVKQTNGQLQLLGSIYDSAPYGYVVKQGSTQFEQVIQQALQELIQDGTYQKILKKWGVSQGAITNPQINPPAS
jgi:polar amino acid transport system substrate-binding protein